MNENGYICQQDIRKTQQMLSKLKVKLHKSIGVL